MSDDEIAARPAYPRVEGKLRYLTIAESDLIEAIRADPDQERHIVECAWLDNDELGVTVRHPVSERVTGNLFTCPVLHFAQAWLDDEEQPEGRWRMSQEGDYSYHEASFHRIEP